MIDQFERPDFGNFKIYRGVVEDNADPKDVGRVRVRIREIHNENGLITPTNQLPWAEPALGLAWSGGYNITNKDHQNDSPDEAPTSGRYNPADPARTPGGNKPENVVLPTNGEQPQEQISFDDVGNACGTGGRFVVPKRGNWVFVFFESGNHMKPIYFAMAPMARDWAFQKQFRNEEINQKIEQINLFKKEFEPRNTVQGKDWAAAAKVDSRVVEPDLNILPLDHSNGNTNRDVECVTSLNGTTIIIDNRLDKEQIFVIHKNYMEYTDVDGNRKVYVGKRHGDVVPNRVNDPDVSTNYEIGVEGNHLVHIFGNYDLYTKGRIHIQCDEHVQIDAKKSVGILSKEGDIDLIVENGNVNLDVQKGYVDAHIAKNLNAHIEGNINAQIDGSLNATVAGNSDLTLVGDVKLEAGSLDATINGEARINVSNGVDITSPNVTISGDLDVGGYIRAAGTCDVKGTAKFGSNVFVQTGIDCGGYLRNRGEANLGSPLIAHGLAVVGGTGTGRGGGTAAPSSPNSPTNPAQTTQETGNKVDKDFETTDPATGE